MARQGVDAIIRLPPTGQLTRCAPLRPSQADLLRCVTDRSLDACKVLARLGLVEEQQECVVALRGLLAYGVLDHCLQMRPLVDYGINR